MYIYIIRWGWWGCCCKCHATKSLPVPRCWRGAQNFEQVCDLALKPNNVCACVIHIHIHDGRGGEGWVGRLAGGRRGGPVTICTGRQPWKNKNMSRPSAVSLLLLGVSLFLWPVSHSVSHAFSFTLRRKQWPKHINTTSWRLCIYILYTQDRYVYVC